MRADESNAARLFLDTGEYRREGCGRASGSDLGRFLQMAAGSASELQYHLLLARALGLLAAGQYSALGTEATELKRMLWSLIKKVRPDR